MTQKKSAVVIFNKIAAAFLFARQKGVIYDNIWQYHKTKKKGLLKMKKLLSLLLVIAMLITPISVFATDENTTITAYVTVSIYGEFAETADGEAAVLLPVELTGKSEYTLDDLFIETHNLYSSTDSYASETGDYGAYITKFWGDESGNFGYQVNGGTEAVMGLNHTVENGDYADVTIYKSFSPDTEAYTKFDRYEEEILESESIDLTLYQAEYDANWNIVFSPCEGATVTINGEETEFITDAEGMVNLYFDEAGTYTVSAYKAKTVNEETVPAITAPVCVVTVNEPEYVTVIRNIAEKYSDSAITSDTNMVWLIADIAVYNELYPENRITFTSRVEQSCLDKIIADADKATAPSALAKDIIALRAMGYDAKNVYNSKSKNIDIVQKLTDLVDAQDEAVTNVYTLPYVIIALRQGEGYATEEQMNYLIESAISTKASWQNDEWGTDAATAMLLALAPYYSTNEDVKSAIDETVTIVTSAQTETGLIGNAASTGIAVTALSALGIDPQTVICNENSLIDGLISLAAENLDGFEPMENSFSTEQGFRGLLAWQLYAQGTDRIMYDFSSYPAEEAHSTRKSSGGGGGGGGSYKPVVKEPEVTEDEEKTETEVKTEENQEDTKVEAETKNPDVKVMPVTYPDKTFDDIKEHKNKAEIEALAKRGIINGKSEKIYDPDTTMTRAEFATIITKALGLSVNNTTLFKDVKPHDWYYTYINTAYHYGIVKGVSDTEFNPNGVISRQEAAVMVARAAKLCGMNTEMDETASRDVLAAFTDYIQLESWSKDSVAFCFESGILSDESIEILPKHQITRAEVASMVYNTLDKASLLQEETK